MSQTTSLDGGKSAQSVGAAAGPQRSALPKLMNERHAHIKPVQVSHLGILRCLGLARSV